MAVPAVLPRRDARRTLPLGWCAPLYDPSGYADEARGFLGALEGAGYDVAARAIVWNAVAAGVTGSQRAMLDRATARGIPKDAVLVQHCVPGLGVLRHDGGPTVQRTMFETDRIPAGWPSCLLDADEIWVPSQFNVETFQRGGIPARMLHTLPGTLDFDLFDPAATEPLPLAGARGFVFLATFDFTDRKGWDILLDAWAEAFAADDDVSLVLKLMSLHGESVQALEARIDAHLGGRATAPIVLLHEVIPAVQFPRLYAAADAFVLPSRGEGWGRPYMEAMAMGLPTIGSRWSGNTAFMHDGNSFLLDGRVVDVERWAQLHSDLYAGHRWFEPEREHLTETLRLVARGGVAVEARAAAARADLTERFGPEPTAARIAELTDGAIERWSWRRSRPVACVWRGDWGGVHSLAVVNDGVADALEAGGGEVVRRAVGTPFRDLAAAGVSQQWPPSFEPPSEGPFVLYQPWEFGEAPAAWVEPIRERVDEVWTPSAAARESFVAAGVAPDLVHVLPNGVDLDEFDPEGPAYELPARAGTTFLFVGGLMHRKGVDLLLEAYAEAFGAADDVLLVLKSFGARTLYRDDGSLALVDELARRPGAPALLVLDEDVARADVPALYRAADVVVQPYRGEGFCLPALEGLACGRPVIVTDGGPTDDFVTDACGWRVPSRRVPLPEGTLPPELMPAGGGFYLEPDVAALAAALREAADPAARAARAAAARPHAQALSWDAVGRIAEGRLAELAGRTPVRRIAPAVIPDRRSLLLAVLADWERDETWAPAVDAYVEAFGPADDVTLLVAGPADAGAAARVEAVLAAHGDGLPDLALGSTDEIDLVALELAADAVVGAGTAVRARHTLPPDPAALRAFADR